MPNLNKKLILTNLKLKVLINFLNQTLRVSQVSELFSQVSIVIKKPSAGFRNLLLGLPLELKFKIPIFVCFWSNLN